MPELHRIVGHSKTGDCTLILTDSDLTLAPSPEFREELREAFATAEEGAEVAPGVIGWFIEKVMHFAEHHVEEAFKPHPLKDVHLALADDFVTIKIGHINYGTTLQVDPEAAYIFRAKFDRAKEALTTH